MLVVEDDELLAQVMAQLLGRVGQVRTVDSGEQALAVLDEQDWALIVADVELPGISGLEMLAHVRERAPLASTLVLSGHKSFEYAVQAIRAGADDYLTKPFDPGELLAKVAELIERAADRRREGREVVLAIGAHPDDVEIGVGGVLLRHVAEGHDVAVLTLTGGEHGGDSTARASESQQAAEMIGARLFLTDLPDTTVAENGETIATIARVVAALAPTIVYTHTSRDVHQDHRNVHSATLVAARRIPRVYCYQAPSTRTDFLPVRFASIDEHVHRKLEVIEAYRSQTAVRHYLDPELLLATARYWARFTDHRYVEPLEVVRDAEREGTLPRAPETEDAPTDVADHV